MKLSEYIKVWLSEGVGYIYIYCLDDVNHLGNRSETIIPRVDESVSRYYEQYVNKIHVSAILYFSVTFFTNIHLVWNIPLALLQKHFK